MWINRHLKKRIDSSVLSRPAVLITGARQTGKSSLLQRIFKDAEYITFDHLRHVEAAKSAPEYFLNQFKGQVILDEIQYVPELFRELKICIDRDRQNYGKWILTGSQQFELMEHISESLAGRLTILHLETLSASELRDKHVEFLSDFLWKGGYPEIWSNAHLEVTDFFESYLRTYGERDLKEIINVKNLSDFRRFMTVLAARTGQLLNYRNISRDIGVSDVTIRKWVHTLEVCGLIYLLPPYFANIGKRLTKSPKIYFSDHGLLCHLLGIEHYADWYSHPYKGNLWENFTMMELMKTHHLVPGKDMFFYRDQNGVEIDFIIQRKQTLMLLEAKVSERIDHRKLKFSKVEPLLSGKFKTIKVLAHLIPEKNVSKQNGIYCFNPLRTEASDLFAV